MQEHWQACAALISTKLSEAAYKTWIKPLEFVDFDADAGVLRLAAPSQIKADVVRKQYQWLLNECVATHFEASVTVELEVGRQGGSQANGQGGANGSASNGSAVDVAPTRSATPATPVAARLPASEFVPTESARVESTRIESVRPGTGSNGSAPGIDFASLSDDDIDRQTTARPASEASASLVPEVQASQSPAFAGLNARQSDDRTKLNPDLTFMTFVTGKANDLARAAALQVSERPGGAYNPLFIHGGVGLGKTHLMHAVGNVIVKREPGTSIRYVTANQFFQDMVSAVRREAVDSFKRYYQALDLLLIDDIQFLSEKKRSQEEFFYVFESLVADNRQILITSDTYPKELQNIDDRLVSRFNSGLIVAIEPPELEMRVAILQRKAEQARLPLSEDVAYFVAKNIRQNVRELEGALQRIIHYASFRKEPITLDVVKDALKDILSFNRGQISIELIQRTVADFYKLKLADMYSKRKPAKIAVPRQIAMYLAKELTQKSLPEIGEAFGGKDHTTVLYAVRKIAEVRAHNNEMNHQIHVLEQTLREYL